MRVREWRAAPLVLCLIALLASCGSQPATKVLFIGNSFTFYNGGIDAQLAEMAPSCRTQLLATGGYTLQKHWNDAAELQTIRSGRFSYVVLQEQSQTPVYGRALFATYAADFSHLIRASGSRPVLLMTWQRPDSAQWGVTTANLAAAYQAVGANIGAKVAPAGLAFANALALRPDLVLNNPDGHPTMDGTYLAACVVYGTIFGRSPVGIGYAPAGISPEVRDFFQQVAAQTLGY